MDAEQLVELLQYFRRQPRRIHEIEDLHGVAVGVCKLVFDMEKRGPAFIVRAIFEGWDQARIREELY